MLSPMAPGRRRSPRTGVLASLAAVLLAGLAAFAVALGVTRLDATRVRAVTPPAATAPAATPQPLADVGRAALSRVVTIEAERSSDEALGTGWLVDSHGDFVTNAHVIEGQIAIRITDRQDRTHVAVVLGIDETADIAVLRSTDGFDAPPLPVDRTPLQHLPLDVVSLASSRATGQADITEEAVVALDQDVPLQNGEVAPGSASPSVYHDMLGLSGARVYQGNSGGPVLDQSGQVVGIITLASPTGTDSFAIPITRVLAEITRFAAQGG